MLRQAVGWVAGVTSAATIALAQPSTFQFSPAEFRKQFDEQVRADGGDLIYQCTTKAKAQVTLCTYRDAIFQKAVRGFTKMGLARGKFKLTAVMILYAPEGKVTKIGMSGSRDTPMGLFHFIGQVGSAIKTLQPTVSQDQVTRMLLDLGLMRGDDDPTTGRPMEVRLTSSKAMCLTENSRVSSVVTCVFTPSQ